jgi:stimulus-sensing protein
MTRLKTLRVGLEMAVLLVVGADILYGAYGYCLSYLRSPLIDAERSLVSRGQFMAAIAPLWTREAEPMTVDPERLRLLWPRLSSDTRARIYDRDGGLVADSRNMYGCGEVCFGLPLASTAKAGIVEQAAIAVRKWYAHLVVRRLLGRPDLPLYREPGASHGSSYPEVAQALGGKSEAMMRINERGEVILSVAVPLRQFRAPVRGAILISAKAPDLL